MTARLRTCAVFALLACGMLISMTVGNSESAQNPKRADFSALDAPQFSIEFRRGQLLLVGFTSSIAHEQALAQLVARNFDTADVHMKFRPLVVPPRNWSQVTTNLLQVIATTQAADALVSGHQVRLRGITDNASAWTTSLDTLRASLAADVLIDAEVRILDPMPAVEALCQRAFSEVGNEPVNFRQSNADIRTSSYATLDAIVSIAYDCNETIITITGHSDASGYEVNNQRLSLQRAQAVADYLTRGGLARERLLITGAGSLVPIADNANAPGRNLNRRIEFEMLPAEPQAALESDPSGLVGAFQAK
jgi:OOP family OmpA-OmpF porin